MKSFAQLDKYVASLLSPSISLDEVVFEPALSAGECSSSNQLVLLLLVVLVPKFNLVGIGLVVEVECLAPFGEMTTFIVYLSNLLFWTPIDDEIRPRLINVLISIDFDSFHEHFNTIRRYSGAVVGALPITLETTIVV